MGVFLTLLAVVAYLAFLVDWKGFMEAFSLGGWATIAVYIMLTVVIVAILSAPETAAVAPAVHH